MFHTLADLLQGNGIFRDTAVNRTPIRRQDFPAYREMDFFAAVPANPPYKMEGNILLTKGEKPILSGSKKTAIPN